MAAGEREMTARVEPLFFESAKVFGADAGLPRGLFDGGAERFACRAEGRADAGSRGVRHPLVTSGKGPICGKPRKV